MTDTNIFNDRDVMRIARELRNRARVLAKDSDDPQHWKDFHQAREMLEKALEASRDNVREVTLCDEHAALMHKHHKPSEGASS